MRIIMGLAAGMAAIAIGPAAAAPGGGPGPGQGAVPTWSYGPGRHIGKPGPAPSGIAWIGTDRRHGRDRGPKVRHGRHLFHPYGGFGTAGLAGAVDPYGAGFFTGGGGRIRLRGGQPYFDYDRSYPYEWAPAARAQESDRAEEAHREAPRPRCTFENGVRVCRGW
jgi:hypothetical protein